MKKIGKGEKGVILAKVDTWENKQNIMRNKKKLGRESIYIDQGLTYKERGVQRNIVAEVRKIRTKGRMAKVGYQKI